MSKRKATIQLHCAGRAHSEIIKLLKVANSTVYYIVRRFKEFVLKTVLGVEDHAPIYQRR